MIYLMHYDSATEWKKEIKCCKNNFYLLSSKRCLLQYMDQEPCETKATCGVLLKHKKTEEGRKKKNTRYYEYETPK
ncbi:hypothetical protein PFNF54_00133 [Plasmodium falciparum NF54]|uniref:Uncharacterized protein n=1 Tax=Plasmodium falciparum (isolate NF54) TaxID=5843 RepID=W7KBQ9_PLAFO|nr:hypothetical protein PFNF54_00133 [Plasmodium falciparum NF54]